MFNKSGTGKMKIYTLTCAELLGHLCALVAQTRLDVGIIVSSAVMYL